MLYVLLTVAFIAIAVLAPRISPTAIGAGGAFAVRVLAAVLAFLCIAETSFVQIPGGSVGIVRKLYGGHSLPEGHVIATQGETGFQARIIPPGAFYISPFINVLNEIDVRPIVQIPQGYYGRIVARDGAPLPGGQIMADEWPDAEFGAYLNAETFMAGPAGNRPGQKGLQASVLKPGVYPINLALFEVKIGHQPQSDVYDNAGYRQETGPLDTSITKIPSGFVGVVRSTISQPALDCTPIFANTHEGGLEAKLVPRGCAGIWNVSLPPGDYYLNRDAFDVTLVDTRVQTLEFKGGYTRRYIDLKVDQKGDFAQSERTEQIRFDPSVSNDAAVGLKVEGWEVAQELRVVLQIRPGNAPIIVASVGTLAEVEKRIMIPAIRSHVRNVAGGQVSVTERSDAAAPRIVSRATRILDLIEQRPALEAAMLRPITEDGSRAGVDVTEIRLGESVIPPELLVARQREQLAQQLKRAYEQEQIAQAQRQASEQARATADQQKEIVGAQINLKKAQLNEETRAADGRAERAYLEQQAAGQTAQVSVLGQVSVLDLQKTKMLFELLGQHPELVANLKLPSTVVFGSGGLEGSAAILGNALGARPAAQEGK